MAQYDFAKPVREALSVDSLEQLHTTIPGDIPLRSRANDTKTPFHERYYENIDHTSFEVTYRKFVMEVVAPLIGEPFYVQRVPSFRVHLPGNVAVGEYHLDSYYGHQSGAINFWVPLTDSFDSNTIQVLLNGKTKPSAISVKKGECLVFDGVGLMHGNKINTTGFTRVSFDIRVVPKSQYIESEGFSVNVGVPLNSKSFYTDPDEWGRKLAK